MIFCFLVLRQRLAGHGSWPGDSDDHKPAERGKRARQGNRACEIERMLLVLTEIGRRHGFGSQGVVLSREHGATRSASSSRSGSAMGRGFSVVDRSPVRIEIIEEPGVGVKCF